MNNPITQNKNNPFNKVEYQQEGNLEVCQIYKSPEITYLYSFNIYKNERYYNINNGICKTYN